MASKRKQSLDGDLYKPVMQIHHDIQFPVSRVKHSSPSDINEKVNCVLAKGDVGIPEKFISEIINLSQMFPNLQTDISVLTAESSLVYILGTNHANSQCRSDVVNVIRHVKPTIVVVELCACRACGCSKHRGSIFQAQPEFTFKHLRKVIKQIGFIPALIFFTDVFRENQVANENIFLDYGGELISAMAEAKQLKSCEVVLGDRPIDITMQRQASLLGKWCKIRLISQVMIALLFKRWMKPLLLNASALVFRDPKTYDVLVFERDLFLTHSIQVAAARFNSRIIAVVGQGHVAGIQKYWGKVSPIILPFILSPNTIKHSQLN